MPRRRRSAHDHVRGRRDQAVGQADRADAEQEEEPARRDRGQQAAAGDGRDCSREHRRRAEAIRQVSRGHGRDRGAAEDDRRDRPDLPAREREVLADERRQRREAERRVGAGGHGEAAERRPTRRPRSCARPERRRFARHESLTYSRRGWQRPLRTILFVPGNDRRKIDKALGLGATAVMLDLEDAVAASEKAAARAIVCESALSAGQRGPLVGVRINALASGLADADLDGAGPGALAHRPDHGAHGRGARRDPSRGRTARRARAGGRSRPRAESTCSRWPRPRAACSRRARSPSPRRGCARSSSGPPISAGSSAWSRPPTASSTSTPARRSCSRLARPARRAPSTARISSSTTTRAAPSRRPGRGDSAFRARSSCTRGSCRSRPPRSRPSERELAWAREVDRAFARGRGCRALLDQARRRDVRRLPRGPARSRHPACERPLNISYCAR